MIRSLSVWILIFMFSFNTFGQSVDQLENDLDSIDDIRLIKQKVEKILEIEPFNESAIILLVYAYIATGKSDSIPVFFSSLKQNNPNSPIPYLLSARYQFKYLSLKDTTRIVELDEALKIDHLCLEANQLMAISYYELFNAEIYNKNFKKAEYYASQSRKYFIKTCEIDNNKINYFKYPIIQLSHFLNNLKGIDYYRDYDQIIKTDSVNRPLEKVYFPISSFLVLPDNWERDYGFDLIDEIEYRLSFINSSSEELYSLQEPLIFNQKFESIYRFVFLTPFDPTIVIRIEKRESTYLLFWKIGNYPEDYNIGMVVNESKEISESNWKTFECLLKSANIFELPIARDKESFVSDGSTLIIEGVENNIYLIVEMILPCEEDLQKCIEYLFELAEI